MSGTEKQKVYYWDSCAYLAWLQDEKQHGQNHLDALAQILQDNFQRKNVIVTSTLTLIEVLAAKIGEENEIRFRECLKRQNHILRDIDPPVALKAREFREVLLSHESGKKFPTPDAIHVATAAIYKVDALHTFDGGKKEKKSIPLLDLSKDPRIEGIVICRPFVNQGTLL